MICVHCDINKQDDEEEPMCGCHSKPRAKLKAYHQQPKTPKDFDAAGESEPEEEIEPPPGIHKLEPPPGDFGDARTGRPRLTPRDDAHRDDEELPPSQPSSSSWSTADRGWTGRSSSWRYDSRWSSWSDKKW